MSAALTFSKIAGQSSRSHPCSVKSGHTPVAISWSTARTTSTDTPRFSMIAIEWSARPRVFEISGERFSVQLTYTALKSLKSHCDSEQSCSSVWRSTDPPSNKAPQANTRRAYAFGRRLATETSPKLEARRSHHALLD